MILVHPLIDPVIASFGIFQIRWYSIAYVLGFIIGLYLIKFINNNSKTPIKDKTIENFFIWSIIGVIFGGRLGYILFYQTKSIYFDPLSILFIWKGGMSFHGGLIGLILSIYFYSKKKNISFFQLSDLISIVAPIGIFFGRIANFINIELYGRDTNFNFAMIYPTIDNLPRHPSQLYEALFEGIILFAIMYFLHIKKIREQIHGINTSFFLILYGIFRFSLEFLREPDFHIGLYFNFFSIGQLLSIPMVFFGLIILFKLKKNYD